MSANNQIQAENVSSLSLREASEKAVSALEGLLDHGKNAPWQAWEKALNANTFLRQALVAAEVDRHDAPDDVEVIYLVWAFQGHGSWTDATKEQYEKAKHDDRMAVVSLDAYLSKEQRTRPQPQTVAQGWKLVPVEPTPEMRKAGIMVAKMDVTGAWVTDAEDAYRAMLSASPEYKP